MDQYFSVVRGERVRDNALQEIEMESIGRDIIETESPETDTDETVRGSGTRDQNQSQNQDTPKWAKLLHKWRLTSNLQNEGSTARDHVSGLYIRYFKQHTDITVGQ